LRNLILFRITALAIVAYLRDRDRFSGRKVCGRGLAPLTSLVCVVCGGFGTGIHPGLKGWRHLGRFYFGGVNHPGLQKTQTCKANDKNNRSNADNSPALYHVSPPLWKKLSKSWVFVHLDT
jgi:hypothetical protein